MRWGRHPRGLRWAFMDWDLPGLRAAVQVQGTLNDASDIDEGWTAEIAFPWSGLKTLAGKRPVPPRDGDVWRMDFSRFELLNNCGVTVEPHPGWALNKHGVYDSHIPECFSFVHFSELDAAEAVRLPAAGAPPRKRGPRGSVTRMRSRSRIMSASRMPAPGNEELFSCDGPGQAGK